VAAAVAFLSPMICALSFTSHAHLLSRGLLAFALWCYVSAEARSKPGWWAAMGFGIGAAFFCRPFETGCLMGPLVLMLLVRAVRRESGAVQAFGAFAAGAAGPLVAFALFNLALTGNPFFPARFAPNPLLREPWLGPLAGFSSRAVLWHRFGANTSYNLLMLAVWFGGPLGAALAVLGIPFDRFTRLLGCGVLCNLGLGLLHDNSGIHLVGPIHYSESAVPLTLLAVHGIVRLKQWCQQKDIGLRMVSTVLCGAAVLSLGTFIGWQSLALRRQAFIQQYIYGFLDSANLKNAIVLAPQFGMLWRGSAAGFINTATFVFEWRRPMPDWSDNLLILHDVKGVIPPLREHFADRSFFRLRPTREAPFLELTPLGASLD
jgi:multisubunit Na+/H+ antiporter MnhB subunit